MPVRLYRRRQETLSKGTSHYNHQWRQDSYIRPDHIVDPTLFLEQLMRVAGRIADTKCLSYKLIGRREYKYHRHTHSSNMD